MIQDRGLRAGACALGIWATRYEGSTKVLRLFIQFRVGLGFEGAVARNAVSNFLRKSAGACCRVQGLGFRV